MRRRSRTSWLSMALTLLAVLPAALPALAGTAGDAPSSPDVREAGFASEAAGKRMGYHVYVPGDYDKDPSRRFPVVYWLHGSGGYPPGVVELLAKRFNAAIRDGKVPAMLVVFPHDGTGHGMWVDAKDGSLPMETVVVRELVPHVDASFRTVAAARGRIVEGGSMGGYGAARLGFKYPALFGAVSMLNAGPLQERLDPQDAPVAGRARAQATLDRTYGGDVEYFRAQSPWVLAERNADAIRERVVVRQMIGGDDPSLGHNRRFSSNLEALGIAHAFEVLPGVGHSPGSMFAALGDGYWAFFRRFLEDPD